MYQCVAKISTKDSYACFDQILDAVLRDSIIDSQSTAPEKVSKGDS